MQNRQESVDVRHLTKLARLRIGEEQINSFAADMENILAMVDKLPKLSGELTPDIENAMTLRADIQVDCMPRELILSNAPQVEAGCFAVPKTVE